MLLKQTVERAPRRCDVPMKWNHLFGNWVRSSSTTSQTDDNRTTSYSVSVPREKVECVVIGAGVVGIAMARALALKGKEVLVIESAPTFGTGTSSRNSEVIHAGIYYPRNSFKVGMSITPFCQFNFKVVIFMQPQRESSHFFMLFCG